MIKQKIKIWLKRYLPAEIICSTTAIGAASITNLLYHNAVLSAYMGTLGEGLGFYSTIMVQHLMHASKEHKAKNTTFRFIHLPKIILNIILEFGPAGTIDGLIIRPFYMYIFPLLLHNFTLGILAGKISADISFYLLVIISLEIKTRHQKKYNKESS